MCVRAKHADARADRRAWKVVRRRVVLVEIFKLFGGGWVTEEECECAYLILSAVALDSWKTRHTASCVRGHVCVRPML